MSKKKNKYTNLGIRCFFLVTFILFISLIARISYLQLSDRVEGRNLKAYADENYNTSQIIPAKRGTIYDANGIPLAEEVTSYTVSAVLDPSASKNSKIKRHVVDKVKTARELSPILETDEAELLSMLGKPKYQVELGPGGRNISQSKKEKIEKLKLPGIVFTPSQKRYYPNGVFASHTLGYTSINENGELIGEMGLEKSLNNELTERDGKKSFLRDRKGNILPYENEKVDPPQNGSDIYLTIDTKIQSLLEDAMTRVDKEYEPEKIMAIVSDPKTGKIIAMGNRPSFNPNINDITNYTNDPISYAFEAGSTMKIFTLGAAMNEGVYNGKEYFQSGRYKVPGGGTVHDVNRNGWGSITFDEGIQRSSNVGISILLNEKLGADRFLQYYKNFGFTKKSNINLPGESSGQLVFKYPLEKTTTAFGQGSTVTAIQIIQAASAIANDGKMMKPYIVDKVVDHDTKKIVDDYQAEVAGNPITSETAKRERKLLESVVTAPSGTGHNYAIKGYSVAGKTGTAQVVDEHGKYIKGHGENLFSFIGMAPAEDPELVVYVAVLRPKLKDTELGSDPVSEIFRSVTKGALEYRKVEPVKNADVSKLIDKESVEVPDFNGLSISEAKSLAISDGLKAVSLGIGNKVSGQSILKSTEVVRGTKIYLKTDGTNSMPSIIGWSRTEVNRLSALFNLNLTIKGSGFITSQSIKKNAELREKDYLAVELNKPQEKDSTEKEIKVNIQE
ncbi:penicillin-binding transpeptidase domain-containing protein [Bacillus sp. EAC]|uniref:penicillin-binding transpeptidase domain-containing protein n=1 Tax=Bacillus sp. EAC TaxID=1978338 RepID=UPI000B43332E|nr:penicillin-binding transpeptidase domain-containing protein [Bacillus sp. EAC]